MIPYKSVSFETWPLAHFSHVGRDGSNFSITQGFIKPPCPAPIFAFQVRCEEREVTNCLLNCNWGRSVLRCLRWRHVTDLMAKKGKRPQVLQCHISRPFVAGWELDQSCWCGKRRFLPR